MHVIVLLWLACVALVGPRGEFPLNDDWSYAVAVERFLETGTYRPTGWTSMPLVTNVAWGALFCLPFGVSFEALRASTVVAGAVGGYGMYALAAAVRTPRWFAALTTATVLLGPLYLPLSVTFMTDVPHTALVAWAAVFLVRHLRDGSSASLAVGTALAVAATLSRQTGLALPLAFGAALLARRGAAAPVLWRAALPTAASAGALIALGRWLSATGRTPALYSAKTEELVGRLMDPAAAASTVIGNGHSVLLTLGLLLAPVLIPLAAGPRPQGRPRAPWLLVGSCALVGGLSAARAAVGGAWPLPLLGNVLVEEGVGPATLVDAAVLDLGNVPSLPPAFWAVATAVGVVGAGALIAVLAEGGLRAWGAVRAGRPAAPVVAGACLLLCAGITLVPLLPGSLFDRYLLPVLPLAAVGLGALGGLPAAPPRPAAYGAVAGLAALAAYAVAGTHDYLTWNRARWDLLGRVAERDPAAWRRIDGGFEFNGLTRYDPDAVREEGRSWWAPDVRDVVAFGPVPGYRVVDEEPYRRWLPPSDARVVWLRADGPARAGGE